MARFGWVALYLYAPLCRQRSASIIIGSGVNVSASRTFAVWSGIGRAVEMLIDRRGFLGVGNTFVRVTKKMPYSAFLGHCRAFGVFGYFWDLLVRREMGHFIRRLVCRESQWFSSWRGMVSARWR